MKILFFVSGLGAGGKERRFTELMKALKYHENIEFELVIMSHDVHYEEVFDLNVKIHYLIRKVKKDPFVLYRFMKLCRSINPDIVHCWDTMTATYCAFTCKILGIKLVNGMISDAQYQKNIFNKNRFRALITFPFSNIIVGNSRAGLIAYSAPQNKSVVIHNGFNFNRIADLTEIEKIKSNLNIKARYIIGMVATFSRNKDYVSYFAAAKKLLESGYDICFLAIGYNTDSEEAAGLIDKQFLSNFRLLGKRSDVESHVNAMDICVLSTFTEGISNSILEYMALGKPVVATDGGGTKEIVEDGKTGFLVKQRNPDELAEKMEKLINDIDLRNKMGMAGKERVHKMFSIKTMTEKYIKIYNEVR